MNLRFTLTKDLTIFLALALSTSVFWPIAATSASPRLQNAAAEEDQQRTKYEIKLNLDFSERSYLGSERVRWINRGDHATSILFFHLYSNLRSDEQAGNGNYGMPSAASGSADEPSIEIVKVRSIPDKRLLNFSTDDQGTELRVNLDGSVPPQASTEIEIDFKGGVPEIDPEETSLTTHIVKQIGAAIRSERELRRARDINFRCRGLMMLGTSYPVLAVHDGGEWRRRIEPTVGDMVFNEAADYEVTVEVDPGIVVFGSGAEQTTRIEGRNSITFAASGLRDFAIVAGPGLRVTEAQVGNVTLCSVFFPEHEKVGRRVLATGAKALQTFINRFGPLPVTRINLIEAPLVAGLGSTEFSGMGVIASAFYIDFDSPAMRNLPEIIREQRPSVEESLEWAVGHLLAHQWWGVAVGNDPAREPILDEALSCWSALVFYRDVHGPERAEAVLQDQLLGVYRLYRTFGGQDMEASRPSRDYRNSLQYAAIVATKGALMLENLERLLGLEKFLAALRSYYRANRLEIAEMDDLRGAIIAESPIELRRSVGRTFNRWLSSKRGDEDIAPPDQDLASSIGLPTKASSAKAGDRNAFTAFARVGKFFWQQMTRIR